MIDRDEEVKTTLAEKPDGPSEQEVVVQVTIVARRPRAIVVLLGWIEGEQEQLSNCTHLYHKLDCCTVVVPSQQEQKVPLATVACREVARLVRMSEMSEMGFGTVPLLLHVCGNSGAVLLEQVELLIKDWVSQRDLEDVRHQTRVSPCPVPLRTLKPMGSLKSIPSMTSTVNDESDGEDAVDESPIAKDPMWTPLNHMRSSLSVMTPKRLPFDPCRTQQPQPQQQKLSSTCDHIKVQRIDIERPAAVSPLSLTPRYNMEPRAIRGDFSLIASRLFAGCILLDSVPLNNDLIENPLKRLFAKSATLFSRRQVQSADERRGRSDQLWNVAEETSLSKRLVHINNSVYSSLRFRKALSLQREKGTLVTECVVKETRPVKRLAAYSNVLEDIFETQVKKLPSPDDDEKDDWSSDDEESCVGIEEETWYDAVEEASRLKLSG